MAEANRRGECDSLAMHNAESVGQLNGCPGSARLVAVAGSELAGRRGQGRRFEPGLRD
jgi:hypothetical protein